MVPVMLLVLLLMFLTYMNIEHTKVREISVMHPMTVSFPQVSLGNICSELVKLDVFVRRMIFPQAGCWICATAEEAELVWS